MKRATIALIVGTAVVWIGWDVFLGVTHQDTESMIIAGWVRQANALAFSLGALVAHWCWQNRRPRYEFWPLAAGALVLVGLWDVACGLEWLAPPGWTRHPGLWLGLGLPMGHFFWPQRYPGVMGLPLGRRP